MHSCVYDVVESFQEETLGDLALSRLRVSSLSEEGWGRSGERAFWQKQSAEVRNLIVCAGNS